MAALRGSLHGDDRAAVTRQGSRAIRARLATWHGAAALTVDKDGAARLTVENDKHPPREVWAGNVERAHDPEGQPLVRRAELENEYLVVASYMRGEGRWLARILMREAPASEAYAETEGLAVALAWGRLFRDEFGILPQPDEQAQGPSFLRALQVTCPTCEAVPGVRCVPGSINVHAERVARGWEWRAAEEGR